MPAFPHDGFASCPVCHSLFAYEGEEPTEEQVETRCNNHGREDYTLEERISYALWYRRKSGGE